MTSATRVSEAQVPELSVEKHAGTVGTGKSRSNVDQVNQLADSLFVKNSTVKVIVFTSVGSRGATSGTVIGVARRLAQQGNRTLALEGNLETVLHPRDQITGEDCDIVTQLGRLPFRQTDSVPAILDELRTEYDIVLVDCGAIETSSYFWSLSSQSDGVVLITEAGRTSKQQLGRAIERLRNERTRLLGLVLDKYKDPLPRWLRKLMW